MSEASAAKCITMWRGCESSLPHLVHHFLPTYLGCSHNMETDTYKDKRKVPNPVPIRRLFFRCNKITCVWIDRMAESTAAQSSSPLIVLAKCNIIISLTQFQFAAYSFVAVKSLVSGLIAWQSLLLHNLLRHS